MLTSAPIRELAGNRHVKKYTKRADRVFSESKEAVLSETGDFIIPMKNCEIGPDRINVELGEVLSGKIPGRRSDKEIACLKP